MIMEEGKPNKNQSQRKRKNHRQIAPVLFKKSSLIKISDPRDYAEMRQKQKEKEKGRDELGGDGTTITRTA